MSGAKNRRINKEFIMYQNLSAKELKTHHLSLNNKSDANKVISLIADVCSKNSISFKRSVLSCCLTAALNEKTFDKLINKQHKVCLSDFCEEIIKKLVEKQHKLSDVTNFKEKLFNALLNSGLCKREMIYLKAKGKTPLYEYSEREMQDYPAYLFVNIETCEVEWSMTDFQYSPPRAFFGIERMYRCLGEITEYTGKELNDYIEKLKPDIEILLNNSFVDWDGSNHIARLNSAATEADESLDSAVTM